MVFSSSISWKEGGGDAIVVQTRNETMAPHRQKFSSQAEETLLQGLREIARAEGQQFQVVLEEAMREYIERRRGGRPRAAVTAHCRASVERNRRLGELLAR